MSRLSSLLPPRTAIVPTALAAGIILAILPLTQTRVLPFHDASGIVGLGGALALRDDPAARVRELYDLDIRAYPSALYFGWAWLAGALGVSVELAFNVFLALFCLAGPVLAAAFLLHAFGRPVALALLVLPVAYHHQIWFGFLGSSAAITGLVLTLAFARLVLRSVNPSPLLHAGLAASLLFVAAAHPFSLALTLLVTAPLLLAPVGDTRLTRAKSYGARAAALLPTVLFLASWAGGFFGRSAGQRSLWRTLRTTFRPSTPAPSDATQFLEWLGNGYLGRWDEALPALALVTLVAFLAAGARTTAPEVDRRDRFFLGWAAGALVLGYLFLPMQLIWPELWWGVRVRCVVPAYIVAIALVRPRARGLPLVALAPAALAACAFFIYVTADFRHFRTRALAGFDEAVAVIPPGRSVLGMPARPDPQYTHPHPYLVQHYVARKGGRAVPHLKGHRGSYWITMKEPPPSPPWGNPHHFDFAAHGGWDYFLIERPRTEPPPEPMRTAPPGAVERVFAGGQFEVWRRR